MWINNQLEASGVGVGGGLLGATVTNQIPIHQLLVIALIEMLPTVNQASALANAQRPLVCFWEGFLAHVRTVRHPPAFPLCSCVPDLSGQD